ncbi:MULTISPECIES: wax ester/triacylglycerol synthase family O-acyltransferase [Mycobacterium]|uniref:Diacylglycerol O-acyltransferase n=1 Tax=Mycobacterium colombiense TaxID=339268 RepID=A0A329LL81_9MYCO|nr:MULTISPECIES: wax ester/triacylglycerol synthase family O-acyltransferase [Mycobacterium]MDM4140243.1 wax ester/triacylglycerol synthase family O-acyltransferase [Mycobacterium sp. FLAC0960]RAV07732.1 wax ester/triacylglycerol synthase family O-acyltransferase [Mycobacterium colombiense]
MKRLNGMDAMLLYSETPNLHTHTLKVAIVDATDFDGELSFDLFRHTLRRRLHRLDPLRYKLIDIPWRLHHPMWLQNCEVDLDYHLRRVAVPAPGGRRELDEVIGQIAGIPLDRDRPLWEFHFAEGMADHKVAIIGKIHHALADGVASANLLTRIMDLTGPVQDDRDNDTGCTPPSTAELLRAAAEDHVRQAAALPALMTEALAGARRLRQRTRQRGRQPDLARMLHAPPTFINHKVSAARTFATSTLSLAQVKETGKHLQITINDMVMAIAAGALRELLLRYDGSADQPLVASVPATTDRSPQRISGNELGGMAVSLPTHIGDPLERVRLTTMSTAIAKENNELFGPELYGRLISYLPGAAAPLAFRWLARRNTRNRLFNIPISNVMGPRERGRFAGAPVSEIYSAGPLITACAINITVWSYVDQLNISVIADDRTLGDTHELTDAMVSAFREIRTAAGFPDDMAVVQGAMPPAVVKSIG